MTPALRSLSDAELLDWLRLARTETVGPRTFLTLLARFGSAGAALDALPRLGRGRALVPASRAGVEAELEAAARLGVRFLPLCDPAYPPSLRTVVSAPPVIGVRGSVAILQRSMVAVVGSRNASANNLVFTDRLAQGLGRAGHVVVSGLARGIDARAHTASLDTGTVAVLAGGHDRIYPGEHKGLAQKIAESGAVISEMPLGWEPRGRDFPRRNRIVSGLGLAVVVVEAARRSGSLITARFGAEQGREVFAVPGHPSDPRAEGTNDLLKTGATFCTAVEDVTSVLAPMIEDRVLFAAREPAGSGALESGQGYWDELDLEGEPASAPFRPWAAAPADVAEDGPAPAADALQTIAGLIGPSPVSIDDLVRASCLPIHAVNALVVELELAGTVRREPHGISRLSR